MLPAAQPFNYELGHVKHVLPIADILFGLPTLVMTALTQAAHAPQAEGIPGRVQPSSWPPLQLRQQLHLMPAVCTQHVRTASLQLFCAS